MGCCLLVSLHSPLVQISNVYYYYKFVNNIKSAYWKYGFEKKLVIVGSYTNVKCCPYK